MEKWAANPSFGQHIAFFCLNVDSPDDVALHASKQFSTNLQLENCYTGFFREGSIPSFGQLGCSGFIIAKPDGSIAVPKSPAFLHYRDQAFDWMLRFFQLICTDQNQGNPRTNTGAKPQQQVVTAPAPRPSRGYQQSEEEQQTSPTSNTNHISPGDRDGNNSTNSSLLLSIQSMDEEHNECFDIIQRASQLIHDRPMMEEALRDLYCHLQDHFDHEEHLMNQCKFGGGIGGKGWQGHRSDHERVLSKISVLLDRNISHCALNELISGLAQDLNNHITQYDSLYVQTFHEHGIG